MVAMMWRGSWGGSAAHVGELGRKRAGEVDAVGAHLLDLVGLPDDPARGDGVVLELLDGLARHAFKAVGKPSRHGVEIAAFCGRALADLEGGVAARPEPA
jgi:hypothetical protein